MVVSSIFATVVCRTLVTMIPKTRKEVCIRIFILRRLVVTLGPRCVIILRRLVGILGPVDGIARSFLPSYIDLSRELCCEYTLDS